MCHILIPTKLTIAMCFLDILYVTYGDNNFIFWGDLIVLCQIYVSIWVIVIFLRM